MSSTKRGTIRQVNDHYDTPPYTIQSLLDVHEIKYPALEPCAGNLAIARMLGSEKVLTIDINPNTPAKQHGDYLKMNYIPLYNTIITNPPFNIAEEIIEKALCDVDVDGEVIMLLRLNFLGAQKRKQFWQNTPLKHIYVLSKRPCFINGKSDSIEYAWFIWQDGYEGKATIEVI